MWVGLGGGGKEVDERREVEAVGVEGDDGVGGGGGEGGLGREDVVAVVGE